MLKKLAHTIVFLSFGPLFSPLMVASESTTPIVVQLATEVQRLPLYLAHVDCSQAHFDATYCAQLEKVLQFDLNYNGMTAVVPSMAEKEKLIAPSALTQAPTQADWKALGAFYLIKTRIEGDKLSLCLFAANTATVKKIDNIALTGELAKDRRQIHQLADSLYKTLFGADGIASTKILYTIKNGQGGKWESEVWEADYDGANRRQLTRDSGYAVTPIYVPPKTGFAAGGFLYISYKTGQPKIYYQSLAEGATPQRLTYLRGNQLMPMLSRQRDKLAFISDVTGNPDLFIQPFNAESGAVGKPYQIFSTHKATQGTPTFSPDGKKVAFVSNKDGSPRIYIIDVPAPGTSLKDIKATLVTKRTRESSAPAWSPDGSKIAYCSSVQGVRQIWVYDMETGQERQLTDGGGNKENPTWAPNSLHLIFNSNDQGNAELYLINLNQPDAVKISSGSGEKRFPSWEPRFS